MREMEGSEGMAMEAGGPFRVTARQVALAGATFAVAREGPLERTIRAVAMAVPNERALGVVNARVMGWVEKLHVNETGRWVREGEPLLELYSPDLVTAQEELLLARSFAAEAGAESLLTAARRRLKLWNISDDQIAELERTGEVRRTLTLRSAYTGHVLEKHVIEGQMVRPGDKLFKIADLSTLWIEPAIFEQDISWVRAGAPAAITFDALPAHTFEGRVTFTYPTLDALTRTLKVRVEIRNHDFLLKPNMYGTVRIRSTGPRGVLVPLTAVLPTGERDLAFVIRSGKVTPSEVVVANRGDGEVLVTRGVAVGDTVVASATFLFDSESNLAAAMKGIMLNMGMGLDMGGMQMGDMPMGEAQAPSSADTALVTPDGGGEGNGEVNAEGGRRR
jgi:RND family efflux transporter MFP subunit